MSIDVRHHDAASSSMNRAADCISVPLVLEFLFAPVNLWTGRTLPNFVRFTGLQPVIARRAFAPFKLALALALSVGLFVPAASIAGGLGTVAISLVYLNRLRTRRKEIDGLLAFGLTALAGTAITAIRLGF